MVQTQRSRGLMPWRQEGAQRPIVAQQWIWVQPLGRLLVVLLFTTGLLWSYGRISERWRTERTASEPVAPTTLLQRNRRPYASELRLLLLLAAMGGWGVWESQLRLRQYRRRAQAQQGAFEQTERSQREQLQELENQVQSLLGQRRYLSQQRNEYEQKADGAEAAKQQLAAQLEKSHSDAKMLKQTQQERDIIRHQKRKIEQQLESKEQFYNHRIDALERQLRDALAQMRQVQQVQDHSSTPRTFSSLSEVLTQVEQDFGDILEIWDSAKKSAAKIANQRSGKYKKVYRCFKAIAQIGQVDLDCRRHGISMGKGWEEAMAEQQDVGGKYRPHESSMTINRYGNQRDFSHHGQSKRMERHMTIRGREGALQIYFDITDAGIQIGYCGPHLAYHSSDT